MGATTNDRAKLLFINKGLLTYPTGVDDKWAAHQAWEGYIVGVGFRNIEAKGQREAFEALNITLDDGKERVIITCKFDSGYGKAMAKMLPNVDFEQQVKVSPSYTEDNGEKRGTVYFSQKGTPIKWAFTRENPNGMPEAKAIDIGKAKPFIDYREQLAFLKQVITNAVLPEIQHANARGAAPHSGDSIVDGPPTEFEDVDDEYAPGPKPMPGMQGSPVHDSLQPKEKETVPVSGEDDLPF